MGISSVDRNLRRKTLRWYAAMNIANIFVSQFALVYFSSFLSYLFEDYEVYQKVYSVTSFATYVKIAALIIGAYLAQKMFFGTGKITPLYKKIRWILFASVAGCFIDVSFLGEGICTVYYAVMYFAYQSCIGILPAVQTSMFLILAGSDMEDRVYATSATVITGFVSTFIGSFALNSVANVLVYGSGGVSTGGYFIASVVMGILFLIGSQLIIRNISPLEEEISLLPRNPLTQSSLGEMVKDALTNAPYAAYWIHTLTTLIASTLASSVGIYYWMGMNMFSYYAMGSSISSLFSVFGAPVAAFAGKKFFGKKKALFVSAVMETVMRLLSFAAIRISIWAFCIANGLSLMMGAINNAYALNYALDSAEISMRKTGRDSRIFMVSMLSLASYAVSLVSSPIRDLMLKFAEYEKVNSYSMMGNAVPEALWEAVGGKLQIAMSVVPALTVLLGTVVLFLLYRISDEEAVLNAVENEDHFRS